MTTTDELYRMPNEQRMYYATTGSCIDTRTTYVHIPDNDNLLAVVCDGEQVTISWKDLFKLLKWVYGQWGGAGK
jgi:hypothetical protein